MNKLKSFTHSKDPSGAKTLAAIIALLVAVSIYLWPKLPAIDNPSYFHFVDVRPLFNIPNCIDVVSNLPFLVFGLLGLKLIFKNQNKTTFLKNTGIVLSLAIILTAFGSAYFHLTPNPDTLTWDRLPMTLAFSAILAMVIGDRTTNRFGMISLLVLIPFGLFSVIAYQYQIITLRPYLLVQFGSIAFIVLLMITRLDKQIPNSILWSAVGLYAVAKVLELKDALIFDITGIISGHSLKHIVAALAIYVILSIYKPQAAQK
jgi:hypothetical protein